MARKTATARRVYPAALNEARDADLAESRRKPIDREFSVNVSKREDRFMRVVGPFSLHEALHCVEDIDLGHEYFVEVYVLAHAYPDLGRR